MPYAALGPFARLGSSAGCNSRQPSLQLVDRAAKDLIHVAPYGRPQHRSLHKDVPCRKK